MSVNIKESSRLQFGDLFSIDGVEFWDTLVLPDPIPRQDDIIYTVGQRDRIDLIAYRFYQDAGLWWVIAWANGLESIPTDLKENMQIRIPPKEYVLSDLSSRASRRI